MITFVFEFTTQIWTFWSHLTIRLCDPGSIQYLWHGSCSDTHPVIQLLDVFFLSKLFVDGGDIFSKTKESDATAVGLDLTFCNPT